ncbi:transglycosylase SLT domain-containing protein [Thiomicrorhabdus arctica]|uniref:transglycosylase SLT domain-containing protein n=1 Tax=Thiomicrorhabdus arctica TaxID=131540 RepID=UPI000363EDC7|nr:transglycosylase SLT domain-containing protein [Thiomicrorhabdus arctica]
MHFLKGLNILDECPYLNSNSGIDVVFRNQFTRLGFTCLFLISLISYQSNAFAANKTLSSQQQAFLDAYQSIKLNDRKAIAQYKVQLKGYPLYPYVLYHDYRLHLKNTPESLIKNFIKTYKKSYLSDSLYGKWLTHLAKNKQWKKFSRTYTPQKNQDSQCYNIQALSHTKQLNTALELAIPIWENSTSLSTACRPIDDLIRKHKRLTGSMIWKRIKLAMEKHKLSLAKTLSQDLSRKDQSMLNEWIKVYKNPRLISKPLPINVTPLVKKAIFTQGVRKLAAKDPALAQKSLDLYSKQYGLNRNQHNVLARKIALHTAYRSDPQAKTLLHQVNRNGSKNADSLRWQAQIAIKQSDWPGLLETIELMETVSQQSKQWLYWKARALEATQQFKESNDLYRMLARQRNYYAFMAADRLNLDYQFNPKPIKKLKTDELLKKYPGLLRIQELLAIDWPLSTRREWYHLLKKADKNELQAVAVLASQWKQHAQAIRSLAKAKSWDALNLRFPTPYKQPVMQNAKRNGIDAAWIYGIMRRESAFSKDIRSPVGATGLMQLMPKTAKYMSQKISSKNISYQKLTEAKNNIELGSAYLSYLSQKYSANKVLATAAYNAGPNRVDRWIPSKGTLAADQWIDSIPYTETRAYVKAVLEYTTIFNSLLNQRYTRLKDVMPDIGDQPILQSDPKHP